MPNQFFVAFCVVLSGFLMGASPSDLIVAKQAIARCSIATSRLSALGLTAQSGNEDGDSHLTLQNGLEAFVICFQNYATLQLPWHGSDDHQAAAAASAFLGAPAATPQVIADKAEDCFASLKTQNTSMNSVDFNDVELQCGPGPYMQADGFIVVHQGYH